MRKFLTALTLTVALLLSGWLVPSLRAQFAAPIQAALQAIGYVTYTSTYVQWNKNWLDAAGAYHNWGTTSGTAGYGLRDNSGTIEVKNNAGAWTAINPTSGTAPADAKYILQQANGSLANAQALSALATGLVYNTTTTGVLSIYGGDACTNQVIRALSLVGAASCVTITSAYVDATIAQLVAGANSNITSMTGLTGNVGSPSSVTLANAGVIRGDTTTAHTWLLQGYDNDTGPGYVSFATIVNGNSPTLTFTNPSGGGTTVWNGNKIGNVYGGTNQDSSGWSAIPTVTAGVWSTYAGATCTNQFIRVLSALGAATCASVSLSADVTGTLGNSNGGTGQNSSGWSAIPTVTAGTWAQYAGTTCTNQFVRALSALAAATCASVSLTADVSGILPGANGGSGNGFFAVSGPAASLKTFAFPNASATVLTTNAAVTATQGGTGLDTSASSGVVSINAGTWTINNVLTNTRILVGSTGNAVTSSANFTWDSNLFTVFSSSASANTGILKLSDGAGYVMESFWSTSGSANDRAWQIGTGYTDNGTFDFYQATSNVGNPTTQVLSLFRSKGASLNQTTDPGAGVFNAAAGFSVNNTAGQTATCVAITSVSFTGGILTAHTCTDPIALAALVEPYLASQAEVRALRDDLATLRADVAALSSR